jgi:hypothetical protein
MPCSYLAVGEVEDQQLLLHCWHRCYTMNCQWPSAFAACACINRMDCSAGRVTEVKQSQVLSMGYDCLRTDIGRYLHSTMLTLYLPGTRWCKCTADVHQASSLRAASRTICNHAKRGCSLDQQNHATSCIDAFESETHYMLPCSKDDLDQRKHERQKHKYHEKYRCHTTAHQACCRHFTRPYIMLHVRC